MLDDLRQQAADSFEDEPEKDVFSLREQHRSNRGNFLGMTPVQRLILAILLFAMTCLTGLFFLIVLERIYITF